MPTPLPISFTPAHAAARRAVQERLLARPATLRAMLPEIRARAFAVAGVEDLHQLRSIRQAVEEVAEGGGRTWHQAQRDIAAALHAQLEPGKVSRRAELVLGQNARMAWAAARYEQEQEDKDVFPYLLYQTLGDENVRQSHRDLDGKIVHKDDPFWRQHYPPWDWGCRCTVIELTEAEARAKGIWHDAAKDAWVKSQPGKNPAKDFEWSPGSLKLPLSELLAQDYIDETDMRFFSERMRQHEIAHNDGSHQNVWEWLWDGQLEADRAWLGAATTVERVILRDAATGAELARATGGPHGIALPGDPYGSAARAGRFVRGHHYHPDGDPTPSPDDLKVALNKAAEQEDIFTWGSRSSIRVDPAVRYTKARRYLDELDTWATALDNQTRTYDEWRLWLRDAAAHGFHIQQTEV